jgi:hypothetical protein
MFGYGKPRLVWQDGTLQAADVPVPRLLPTLGRIRDPLRETFRFVHFTERAWVKLDPPESPARGGE